MQTVKRSIMAGEGITTAETDRLAALSAVEERYKSKPLAYVHSFGCQQNVSDGERIKGSLISIGFGLTEDKQSADLILFNTCAVRETAEDRVWGHLGMLKGIKRQNPNIIIALCGCMMQRQEAADRVKSSYPYVDIVFGTNAIHMIPQLIYRCLTERGQLFYHSQDSRVAEGLPSAREGNVRAYLPIMQGCDNFCSYCIVPYVRGREISRESRNILEEAREILSCGYREITLLGQNVNSYGKGLSESINFSGLIRQLDSLPGEFWLRFMTSHPKNCTKELIDTIAASSHIARHIHLPVQSGSDSILRAMNRGYTAKEYLELIDYARSVIPGVTFSSDIIVGFPGETERDFKATLELVEQVRYNTLFTFIYSKRSGTPAAELDDTTVYEQKSGRMQELLHLQTEISEGINRQLAGQTVKVLAEEQHRNKQGLIIGRTEHTTLVEFSGSAGIVGSFAQVKIKKAQSRSLTGEVVQWD